MPSITFTDFVPPAVSAAWLNSTDSLVWAVFNGKSTAGTAGTILRSNGTNIVNTTATYPTTTTANQLLYSSATNTISGLTSANNSVLVTNGSGVPALATTLPSGLTVAGLTISSLSTDLAIADGGTGQSTATAAFDALAPTTTTGDIIYHNGTDNIRLAVGSTGQVLRVAAGVPGWGGSVINGTMVASTSGTSIDFTGIPSGVRRITIMFNGVSTSGTSIVMVQLGDAGGVEPSGYLGAGTLVNTSVSPTVTNATTGFLTSGANAAGAIMQGAYVLTLMDAATFAWIAAGTFARSDTTIVSTGAGSKSLSAELTQVRITTLTGADTFDAGTINIAYQF